MLDRPRFKHPAPPLLAVPLAVPLAVLLAALLALAIPGCASQQEVKVSALHFFNQGNQAFQNADYEGAIRFYNQAVSLDETSVESRYNLGLALFRSGDYERAAEVFEEVLELNPGHAASHFNAALAYDKLYEPVRAHSHYNRYQETVKGNLLRKGQASAVPTAFKPEGKGPAAQNLAAQNLAPPAPNGGQKGPPASPFMASQAPDQPSQPAQEGGSQAPKLNPKEKWWTQDLQSH